MAKLTKDETQLIVESLDKNTASTKRLKASASNAEIQKLYDRQLIAIADLTTKIKTGQGSLI